MNKYNITILFLLVFHLSLKAQIVDDSDSKTSLPPAVMEAKESIVLVSSIYGNGSGFIIRDNKNRMILVTAYHVIQESINTLDRIEVKDIHRKKLKIKQVLASSKMLDTVFLELEDDRTKGLKWAVSPSYNDDSVFILGVFQGVHRDKPLYTQGTSFNHPSRALLDIIYSNTVVDVTTVKGFSGGPILNQEGEVIGMFLSGNILYKYIHSIKSSYMKDLLESPKNNSFAENMIPSYLLSSWHFFRGNHFLRKSNLQRLQAMAEGGSSNARITLNRLDAGQLFKVVGSIAFLSGFTSAGIVLLQAEGMSGIVFVSAANLIFSGAMSYNYCARALTHLTNRVSLRFQKQGKK